MGGNVTGVKKGEAERVRDTTRLGQALQPKRGPCGRGSVSWAVDGGNVGFCGMNWGEATQLRLLRGFGRRRAAQDSGVWAVFTSMHGDKELGLVDT